LDEQKSLIRLEEIYRDEVRKSLSSKETRRGRIFAFLNTPFALWILSSILLTAITATWSAWSNQRDKDRTKNERISKIKTEIAYRLSQADDNLDGFMDPNFILHAQLTPLTGPTHPGSIVEAPAFPEFERRPVKSMLIEWQFMSDEAKEKSNIADFLETIKKLERTGINRFDLSAEEKAELIRQVRGLLAHAKLLLE
jgi:hypothetical protein